MAGATACNVSACEFRIAEKSDDAEIRRLLRETPMRGAADVTFEREPDYFAGENVACGEDATILGFAGGALACMGSCSWRECWVGGVRTRAGYLAELRHAHGMRGRGGMLREGYRFFAELAAADPARCYFTAIVSDNARARRILEAGKPGMPRYRFVSEIVTLLITVPRAAIAAGRRCYIPAAPEHVSGLLRVLNTHGRNHQFGSVWTEARLRSLARHGLPLERFLVALDGGEVVACGALWDQRAFRQTVIRRLPPLLRALRPLINAAGQFLRLPRVPAPCVPLAHAFLSPLACADGSLPDFTAAFFPMGRACGCEFLTLALATDDPRLPAMRSRFAMREWRSRIYAVEFPGTAAASPATGLPALPEVALL